MAFLKLASQSLEICSSRRFDLRGFNVCVLGGSILGFNLGVVNDCLVNMDVSEDGTLEDREWVWGRVVSIPVSLWVIGSSGDRGVLSKETLRMRVCWSPFLCI